MTVFRRHENVLHPLPTNTMLSGPFSSKFDASRQPDACDNVQSSPYQPLCSFPFRFLMASAVRLGKYLLWIWLELRL